MIIGGSHAGVSVIETLRREGFTGRMILVSDEAVPLFSPAALPYLYGERKRQGRTLRGLDFYRGLEVVRTRALAVEPAKSLVRLPGKGRVSYRPSGDCHGRIGPDHPRLRVGRELCFLAPPHRGPVKDRTRGEEEPSHRHCRGRSGRPSSGPGICE